MNESSTSLSNKIVLYLDTSEPKAVLRIYRNKAKLKEIKWLAHRDLSATLTQKYRELLKSVGVNQEELAGIVVFAGPGSFTGLRIGISFANSLAYGLGVPIYETRQRGEFELKKPQKIVVPFYGSEPKITISKQK